jgi:transposase InsO family protein
MKKFKLKVERRLAYKVTTARKYSDKVAYRKAYDHGLDKLSYYKSGKFETTKQRARIYSDRGSQYTSQRFDKLLKGYGIRASVGDVAACWDNAVVDRFFGSLKHDWILKIPQLTCEHMKQDVTAYRKYYNQKRLHTVNGDMSPIKYEIWGLPDAYNEMP